MVASGTSERSKFLIIITGPTAVGKTSVAIEVAKHFNTEIISADSRQFYKGMVIGTAAPAIEDLELVKHYFVGHLEIENYFNVAKYEHDVLQILDQLFIKHRVVVLTGGSGFYIHAVTNGIDELPDADDQIRAHVQEIYNEGGLTELRRMLLKYDPVYAEKVDMANPVRIMRALEVSLQMGVPYSSLLINSKPKRPFNILKIALNIPRNELHNRINSRVDAMINSGLEEEVRSFYPKRNFNSLNTVGYRELFDYFDGLSTKEEAIEKIKTNTRRYARRQITWIKRDKEYHWFVPDSKVIISYIESQL
ncbi:MAG TPA: tRNA (adenosine(37)-N6)-dimethylallyltransferase MiaA [Lentimicrobium sp.]|nr:tRNA (adenosine(37)-N6)-dimethylallyltransferase MiaA [Lentimicrobium sp.]